MFNFVNLYIPMFSTTDEDNKINLLHSFVLGKCKPLYCELKNCIQLNESSYYFDETILNLVNKLSNEGLFKFLFFYNQ
jgi:hypothetical protein